MRRSPSDFKLGCAWPVSRSSRVLMPALEDRRLYKLEPPQVNGEKAAHIIGIDQSKATCRSILTPNRLSILAKYQ